MNTVRFAHVVEKGGKPEVHLLLTNPKFDRVLQRATKANRVMTIHQPSTGTKTDFGTVGFLEGVAGQILIFPKSIKAFAGRNVVGIKYELLADEPVHDRKPRRPAPAKREPASRPTRVDTKKILEFPPLRAEPATADEEVGKLRATARLALKALAEGKQVVAHQLLEQILQN